MRNLIRLFAFLDEQLQSVCSRDDQDQDQDHDHYDQQQQQQQQQQPRHREPTRQPLEPPDHGPRPRHPDHQPAELELATETHSRRRARDPPAPSERPRKEPATGRRPEPRQRSASRRHQQVRINLFQSVSFVAAPSISSGSKASWGPVIDAGQRQQRAQLRAATNRAPADQDPADELDGWILLDDRDLRSDATEHLAPHQPSEHLSLLDSFSPLVNKSAGGAEPRSSAPAEPQEPNNRIQMALEAADIELVRTSWAPARRDPVGAGVLLFKRLFTKFPKYLHFFPQFADIDVDQIQDNKRLLKHAIKVIETVTFAIDSLGDQAKSSQLNEALISLVRAHLKRKIGLAEFRNLGIVIIDFICELNSARVGVVNNTNEAGEPEDRNRTSLAKSGSSNAINVYPQQQASITRGLASLSHDDSYSSKNSSQDSGTITSTMDEVSIQGSPSPCPDESVKLDTNQLVSAWTKFYTIILDLVRREEGHDKEELEEADDDEEISA